MDAKHFLVILLLVTGCGEVPTTQTGGTIGLGDILYTRHFYPPFGTVTVDVKERGFTFAVTSGSVYSCDDDQRVWQDFLYVDFIRWYNFTPNGYSGCDALSPASNASGDVRMLDRMNLDPSTPFQFIFDGGNTFNLP